MLLIAATSTKRRARETRDPHKAILNEGNHRRQEPSNISRETEGGSVETRGLYFAHRDAWNFSALDQPAASGTAVLIDPDRVSRFYESCRRNNSLPIELPEEK